MVAQQIFVLLIIWSQVLYQPNEERLLLIPDSCEHWTAIIEYTKQKNWTKIDKVVHLADFILKDLQPFLQEDAQKILMEYDSETTATAKRAHIDSWMIADIAALLRIAFDKAREGRIPAARAWLEQAYCIYRLWEPIPRNSGFLDDVNKIHNRFRFLHQILADVRGNSSAYLKEADATLDNLVQMYIHVYGTSPFKEPIP